MSELELRSRIDALEAQLAEVRQISDDAYDVGCEYPGEGTEYSIEIPTQQVFGWGGTGLFAWKIRQGSSSWEVFSPFAVIDDSDEPIVPEGMSSGIGWQALPGGMAPQDGSEWTLYAVLKWTPAVKASGGGSSAVEEPTGNTKFYLTTSLPDRSEDASGVIYRIIPIAKRSSNGSVEQIQAGIIVETFPPASGGGGGGGGEGGGGGVSGVESSLFAWKVRQESSSWEVFSPFAVIDDSDEPIVPEGMSSGIGWKALPQFGSGLTLYAVLKWTPAAKASGGGSSAADEPTGNTKFYLTTSLPNRSGDGSGVIYRIIPIARLSSEGDLEQIQAGIIVETFPPASGGVGSGGGVGGGDGDEAKSCLFAWKVRQESSSWEVFSPFAVIDGSDEPIVPEGMSSGIGWQALPEGTEPQGDSEWTLYAVLKWTPEVKASGEGSSATEAQPEKREFYLTSSLPDRSADVSGVIYRIIPIAKRSSNGSVEQIQAGTIVETFPPASSGVGLCAGPLTYYNGRIVQYLGSFDAGGAFTQAKNASGQPIIVADYGAAIDILKRNSAGNEVRTSVGFLPLNAPSTSDLVMRKRTVSGLTLGLTYVAPQYEDDIGGLKATTGVSVTFWGDEPTPGSETTILQTITESANDKTIYEDSSSQGGEQA